MSERIVIVGGGLAAANVVKGYRAAGGDAPMTMLSTDDALPYNRPPLSKGFLRGELEEDAVFVQPESFYEENGVVVHLETEVTGVDTNARSVELSDGSRIEYGQLVLASGSRPRPLDVPGADLEGVHTYRTLSNARTVREVAASAERALVIGGSFIGMETAASLRRRGLEVTQIELEDRLYASLQAPEVSRSLERLYRERGVDVILQDKVAEFRGSGGRVVGARSDGGREIEAGLVIVGVGVSTTTGYLQGSGVTLDDVGAVVVDDRFATSVPGVYAAGDVARFHDPIFGHSRLVQHWTNANHAGEKLGRILAGEDTRYDLVALFFSEVFGTKIGLLGDLDGGHDELIVRGSLEEGRLLGFYLRSGRLVAALLSGQDAATQQELTRLLREQPAVRDRDALADPETAPELALVG